MPDHDAPLPRRVFLGIAPFCGHCMNPFGIPQNGKPIEIGPPTRRFGAARPPAVPRSLCPGIAAGKHDLWGYR